jgi:hypothetical protein
VELHQEAISTDRLPFSPRQFVAADIGAWENRESLNSARKEIACLFARQQLAQSGLLEFFPRI